MCTPRTLVLATSNPHKVEELSHILRGLPLRVIGLNEAMGGRTLSEPAEVGVTFDDNATIKAVEYARQTGMLCLADDSGLEIDALGGRPGVISSHYCTDGREVGMSRAERDAANNERVMRELEGVPEEKRTARFVCVMVIGGWKPPVAEIEAPHPEILKGNIQGGEMQGGEMLGEEWRGKIIVRGTFEGRVGLPGAVPRGANGFGYDPIFLVGPGYRRTSAELSPEEKNACSHRAIAGKNIVALLQPML